MTEAAAAAFELVIRDFAVIMIIASAMALLSFKLKQPMIIGYISLQVYL